MANNYTQFSEILNFVYEKKEYHKPTINFKFHHASQDIFSMVRNLTIQ